MPIANEVYVHEARGWRKLPHEVVMATTFEIGGLSGLDQEELQELLHEKVQFEEPSVPEGTLAEPATIAAIVTLGSGVLFAFATWLSKRRRGSRTCLSAYQHRKFRASFSHQPKLTRAHCGRFGSLTHPSAQSAQSAKHFLYLNSTRKFAWSAGWKRPLFLNVTHWPQISSSRFDELSFNLMSVLVA